MAVASWLMIMKEKVFRRNTFLTSFGFALFLETFVTKIRLGRKQDCESM